MKKILQLFLLLTLTACLDSQENKEPAEVYHDLPASPEEGYLVRVFEGEEYEPGQPCGYADPDGEVVIPIGQYGLCWTDTIRNFGIVWDEERTDSEFIGIDRQGRKLYEVYFYDNGPDWPSEGLFRIVRNGKIGYADEDGYVRIEPRYECAGQFEDGKAKVALQCDLIEEGEHTRMESEAWFFIDRTGRRVEAEK